MSLKKEVVDAMTRLPEDANEDDVLYQTYVVLKIEKGLADADAGRKVPAEEVLSRMKNWSR